VQLTGGLRSQLAQLVSVLYVGKSPKNQVGSHFFSSIYSIDRIQPPRCGDEREIVDNTRPMNRPVRLSVSLDARDIVTGQHFFRYRAKPS
jgi:hypothetical protein